MEPLHYATYFDQHYLLRGLALYRSLVRHSPPFRLWVLCLDEATFATLERLALPGVGLVPLAELERRDPELPGVRETRKRYEYYWTCGPTYLLDLFERQPEIELLTYLDADVFFFDDPALLYAALGDRSLLIVESRRAQGRPGSNPGKGLYSVGVNIFRRTPQGLACLRRWRAQCLEWCYYRFEPNRFGDQKYLDEWPALYDELVVIDHKGVGLAPWNFANYRLRYQAGRLLVDDDPLVVYHFNRLRTLALWLYDPSVYDYFPRVDPVLKRHAYVPYVRELRSARRLVEGVGRRVARRDTLKFDDSTPRLLARMARYRSFLVVTDSFAF